MILQVLLVIVGQLHPAVLQLLVSSLVDDSILEEDSCELPGLDLELVVCQILNCRDHELVCY